MRVFNEIFNQGHFDVADEIYAPDFVNHGLHRDASLREDQAAARAEVKAFPDLRMTVDLVVAEGDFVTFMWTLRGTPLIAAPPASGTGRSGDQHDEPRSGLEAHRAFHRADIFGPDFITLLVRDLGTSYRFYKEQIGLPESSEKHPNAYAFATEPCGLAIRQATSAGTTANPGHGIIVWFRASDATAVYHRLKEHGVPIAENLRKGPFGMIFSFKDPDGYVLTVHDGS